MISSDYFERTLLHILIKLKIEKPDAVLEEKRIISPLLKTLAKEAGLSIESFMSDWEKGVKTWAEKNDEPLPDWTNIIFELKEETEDQKTDQGLSPGVTEILRRFLVLGYLPPGLIIGTLSDLEERLLELIDANDPFLKGNIPKRIIDRSCTAPTTHSIFGQDPGEDFGISGWK